MNSYLYKAQSNLIHETEGPVYRNLVSLMYTQIDRNIIADHNCVGSVGLSKKFGGKSFKGAREEAFLLDTCNTLLEDYAL